MNTTLENLENVINLEQDVSLFPEMSISMLDNLAYFARSNIFNELKWRKKAICEAVNGQSNVHDDGSVEEKIANLNVIRKAIFDSNDYILQKIENVISDDGYLTDAGRDLIDKVAEHRVNRYIAHYSYLLEPEELAEFDGYGFGELSHWNAGFGSYLGFKTECKRDAFLTGKNKLTAKQERRLEMWLMGVFDFPDAGSIQVAELAMELAAA